MLDRLHAIRSFTAKAALGIVVASTVALAACGTPTTSSGTGSNTPGASLCKVTAADITSSVSTTGTATKVDDLSGQKLAIDGSSALAPLFSSAKTSFDTVNGTQTTVTANGSGVGLKDVAAGAVQIGMSDVFASEKLTADQAATLTDHQVGAVVFTLVTNSGLSGQVSDLTSAQVKQIFTGQVTNWSAVGGPNLPITLVTRPKSSGTRATFTKYVLGGTDEATGQALTQETSGALLAAIKGTPGSIGYVSLSFVAANPNDVNPLCIDHAKATAADVNVGKYNFWGIEHAYTKGPATGAAKAFLQFISSDAVQKNDLLKLNYLPLKSVAADALQKHSVAGAPAPESLS
ncbi:MAG TPA: phosphate ABC transporter substrate-binding protein [Ktedonobacterales bacterium]